MIKVFNNCNTKTRSRQSVHQILIDIRHFNKKIYIHTTHSTFNIELRGRIFFVYGDRVWLHLADLALNAVSESRSNMRNTPILQVDIIA